MMLKEKRMKLMHSLKRRHVLVRLVLAVLLVFGLVGSVGAKDKGAQAPDFSLMDTAGNTVSLSQMNGKVVVINFFTIFCQPCRHEMPDLNAIYNENKDKGLAMVGICLNADPNQLPVLVKQLKLDYPVVGIVKGNDGKWAMDKRTEQVSKDYGEIVGVPTTFFVDRQGKIVEKIMGARKKDEFMQVIKPLM
jgi:peroxiredoxin